MTAGRPLKYNSVSELESAIEAYFKACDARTKQIVTKQGDVVDVRDPEPYTISGLAYAMEIDRDTLLNYENREEYFGTIKRAKSRVHRDVERRLMEANSTGAIFNLKNNFGWVDRSEQDYTTKGEAVQQSVLPPELLAAFAATLSNQSKG